MVEHCENCHCGPERICYGLHRRICIATVRLFEALVAIALAFLMGANYSRRNRFQEWSLLEYHIFIVLLFFFAVFLVAITMLETYLSIEVAWSIICGIYAYFCDFIHYLRRLFRIPSWQNIRVRYTRQSALALPECPSSDSSTDEEPPPLPPKSGCILKAAGQQPFQKLTANIEHGASSSATRSDRRQTEVDPLSLPGCSGMQSASSSSQKRSKKFTKKERFRQKLREASNMRTIEESQEASGSRQELSNIEVPLSVLVHQPQSPSSTTRETSFCSDSDTPETEEQAQASGTAEIKCHEHASSAGFSGLELQVRAAGTERSPEKQQKSPEQPSASGYVGMSALQSQARTSGVREIQRIQEGREQISVSESSGLQRRAPACDIQMKQESGEQISAAGSSGSQRQARASDIQMKQESGEQISVAESSGLQRQAPASDIQKMQKSREQISAAGSSASQRQAPASDIQKMQKGREQISAAGSSGLQRQAPASDIQKMQKNREKISAAGSSGLQRQSPASNIQMKQVSGEQISAAGSSVSQRQARASDIQKMQKSRVQTSAASSGLQRAAQASDIQKMQKSRVQATAAGFSGLGKGAQTSDIQMKQKIQKQSSAVGFFGSRRVACESDVKDTESKPEGREQTSAAGYAGFSGLKRQAGKSDSPRIQEKQTSRRQVSSIGLSGLERKRGSETKQLQREEKSRENASEEGHASTSGLASRLQPTSTQEKEINIPRRRSVQREVEEDRSAQGSPKEDSSLASSQGAVGQETPKTGTFSSLNLTGGNLVVSRHGGAEANEAILSSGMDPSGSAFFFDQPMDVLDLSHIEVPILQTESEEETRDDDNDKKENESKN